LRLPASILSVTGPSWLYFEPPELLNYDFDADPALVLAQNKNANRDPASQNYADPEPWFFVYYILASSHWKYKDLSAYTHC
jgi:hypothetical protein